VFGPVVGFKEQPARMVSKWRRKRLALSPLAVGLKMTQMRTAQYVVNSNRAVEKKAAAVSASENAGETDSVRRCYSSFQDVAR